MGPEYLYNMPWLSTLFVFISCCVGNIIPLAERRHRVKRVIHPKVDGTRYRYADEQQCAVDSVKAKGGKIVFRIYGTHASRGTNIILSTRWNPFNRFGRTFHFHTSSKHYYSTVGIGETGGCGVLTTNIIF